MEYENLEETYDRIFEEKVLPFIEDNIQRNSYTDPSYYLLDKLDINRFRGVLPILIGREYGIEDHEMLPVSAFCEFTFTTAMAQDDFYDNDGCREGVEATHEKFGDAKTLVSCNYVNHKLIDLISKKLSEEKFSQKKISYVIDEANKAMESWYKSNLMEIDSKGALREQDEDYLRDIYLSKTIHGRLLLEIVFSLVQDSDELVSEIREYGEHLAIAGQLKNDLYDFIKHEKYRGFSDLRNGHITWPIYFLMDSLNEEEKQKFTSKLQKNKYNYLIELLRENEVDRKVLEKINFHVEEAKKIIDRNQFPETVEDLLKIWAEGNRDFSRKPEI